MRLTQKTAGLEEFARVAESLNFARAADTLGMTPSGLSKAIRQLENRLGLRLLQRTTRRVRLTEDGAQLYERLLPWLAELEDMQTACSQFDSELSGSLRIEMPVTYGRVLFMPFLATFLQRHPKLRVDVRMSDTYVDLVAEGVDLAIRIGDLADTDLVSKPLGRVQLGSYACPSCLSRYGEPQHPRDLQDHRLIAFIHPSGGTKKLQYAKAGERIDIDASQAVVSFNNGEAMTDAAIAGIGIAQLPSFHARDAFANGKLAQVLTGWDIPGPPIQLVYPTRKHLPRRVQVLIDFIADEVQGLGLF